MHPSVSACSRKIGVDRYLSILGFQQSCVSFFYLCFTHQTPSLSDEPQLRSRTSTCLLACLLFFPLVSSFLLYLSLYLPLWSYDELVRNNLHRHTVKLVRHSILVGRPRHAAYDTLTGRNNKTMQRTMSYPLAYRHVNDASGLRRSIMHCCI
jgi:hypothetical protein